MALMEINWKPDARALRTFGLIATAFFGAAAATVFFRHGLMGWHAVDPAGARRVAGLIALLAAVCALGALAAPNSLRPLYVALTVISLPIGWVVSYVMLAVIYYLVFTPVAMVFRLMGRDALERHTLPQAASYWAPRRPVTDLKRYFKQF